MNFLTYILIKLIKLYQYLLSPIIGPSCRYLPTCSEYSIEALKTYGFSKGLLLSLKRIMSCHPWGNSGFDPVKKEMRAKK
jgi:putative membrane protein insertion efficiency factor